jgi:hypothetical protein
MQALPQPTRSFLSILVVAVSAMAFLVSTGVGVVWPLAWLAPIPVLVLSVHRSWRAAAVVAFTASLLGDLTLARTYGPGAVLIFGVTSDSADAVVKVLSDAARAAHATVIAGLSRNGVQPRRNMALVISQDGTLVLQYEKRYLVPMIETTFASGNALGLFAGPEAQWGVAICKDLDFPAWSRAYGRHGVRFLAVPAWDFVRDARMHSRMAVMRGVENGFASPIRPKRVS